MLRPGTFALTFLLAALSAIGPLSVDMYLPSLPFIGQLLSASPSQVQLTISSYLLGFAIGQVVYGPISDRYGRRSVLMAAIALFCVASIACAIATSIKFLIVARFVQAVGGSGAIVLARAVVRDLYEGARAGRELSLMNATMALAPIVAPVVGGALQTAFGWQANFLMLALIGLAGALSVWWLLPETLKHPAQELSFGAVAQSHRGFLGDAAFLANLGLLGLSYAGLFAWISAASFVLQSLHGLSPLVFGLVFPLGSMGFLIGAALAARLVTALGIDRTLAFGSVALAAGGLGLVAQMIFGWHTWPLLMVFIAIYMAGLGLTMPQGMAAALSPYPKRAGAASSLIGVTQQMAAAVTGAIVGQMLGTSAWPLAIAMGVLGTAAPLLWLGSRHVRRQALARIAHP
jgi:DHA1 family bicyclomycin/chloramphenicol resistance-like MFS transporter